MSGGLRSQHWSVGALLRGTATASLLATLLSSCGSQPELAYLGEPVPDATPRVFAPARVSLDDRYEFGSVFSRDGDEFFFGVDLGGRSEIHRMQTQRSETGWSTPEVLLTHKEFGFNDPFLSPDEQRLYFISNRPLLDGQPKRPDHDIWFIEREGETWSEPINVGAPINTEANEYYISFLATGSMVFASNINDPDRGGNFDIYIAKETPGGQGRRFDAPVALEGGVNSQHYEADAFITLDGSLLIFSAQRPGGNGRGDLYVSFSNEDGSWSQAKNLGSSINTEDHELCPFITADGRYLFYTSNEDLYWVSTSILEGLR